MRNDRWWVPDDAVVGQDDSISWWSCVYVVYTRAKGDGLLAQPLLEDSYRPA